MWFMRAIFASAKAVLLAGLVLVGTGFPAPSHAITATVTYTGTLSSGFDEDGLFGPTNTGLAGAAFTLTYVTTDVGTYTTTSVRDKISGTGAASPVKATLTINGLDHDFGVLPGAAFSAQAQTSSGPTIVIHQARDQFFSNSPADGHLEVNASVFAFFAGPPDLGDTNTPSVLRSFG